MNLVNLLESTKSLSSSIYVACEQATVGDRTKENTASEASRGETVPRGELAEEELGGERGPVPPSASFTRLASVAVFSFAVSFALSGFTGYNIRSFYAH